MIKNLIIRAYFCFSCFLGCSQSADWNVMSQLPDILEENSGIVFYPPNKVVYINDSGNNPELISTDTMGYITQIYCLPGLTNVDWEELTRDDKGYIYIGDIGNNRNIRNNLVIYKLQADKVLDGDDSFALGEIHFSYEDQKGFPPERKNRNFDTEAMMHLGDSIYLFTKNRTRPFNGYTYCYRIPDTPGEYLAEKIDSFSTGNGPKEAFWVAGAAYRKNPKTLVLLGYNKLWMFYNFEGTNFFSGKHNVLYFNTFTQKEAVTFFNQNEVLLTDEKNSKDDGNLYKLTLPEILYLKTEYSDSTSIPSLNTVELKDHKVQKSISLNINCVKNSSVIWEAYSKTGQRLYFGEFYGLEAGENKLKINCSEWKSGKYELHIIVDEEVFVFNLKKKNNK